MKKILCGFVLIALAGCVNSPFSVDVQALNSRSAFRSPDAVRGMEGGGTLQPEIPTGLPVK